MDLNLSGILTERLGGDPLHCIDVGARGGMQANWRPFAGLMRIDLFEPAAASRRTRSGPARPGSRWRSAATPAPACCMC
jgi:hypothetical protein